jgi:uncharacterized protein (TIGR02246 family)
LIQALRQNDSPIRTHFAQVRLARLHDAWAHGDSKAYAACFTVNSDYITFNGIHLHGRAENAELHGALFRRVLKGTKLSAEVEGLELLSREVALVRTADERKKSYQTREK